MTEILVKPYQSAPMGYAEGLEAMLSTYPRLEWIAPDFAIASLAAQYRASHRLRTMDALQAATSVRSGAACLVTNDVAFRKIEGLNVILLDDYV
jgi:predicted nucleic acid-binding protein